MIDFFILIVLVFIASAISISLATVFVIWMGWIKGVNINMLKQSIKDIINGR